MGSGDRPMSSDPFRQCGKVRFYREEFARKVGNRRGLRAYRCEVCGAWHLTRQLEERTYRPKEEE